MGPVGVDHVDEGLVLGGVVTGEGDHAVEWRGLRQSGTTERQRRDGEDDQQTECDEHPSGARHDRPRNRIGCRHGIAPQAGQPTRTLPEGGRSVDDRVELSIEGGAIVV